MKSFSAFCALIGLGLVGLVAPATSDSTATTTLPQEASASRRDPLGTLVLEEGTGFQQIADLGTPLTLDTGGTATLIGTTYAWRTLKKNEAKYRLRLDFDVRVSAAVDGKLPHVRVQLSEEDIGTLTQLIETFAAVERSPRDSIVEYELLDASWGDLDFRSQKGAILMSWPGFGVGGKGWLPVNLDALRKALADGRATMEKLKAAKPSARL